MNGEIQMLYFTIFILICLSGGFIYFNFDKLVNELFWHLSEMKDSFEHWRMRNERQNK